MAVEDAVLHWKFWMFGTKPECQGLHAYAKAAPSACLLPKCWKYPIPLCQRLLTFVVFFLYGSTRIFPCFVRSIASRSCILFEPLVLQCVLSRTNVDGSAGKDIRGIMSRRLFDGPWWIADTISVDDTSRFEMHLYGVLISLRIQSQEVVEEISLFVLLLKSDFNAVLGYISFPRGDYILLSEEHSTGMFLYFCITPFAKNVPPSRRVIRKRTVCIAHGIV